MGRGTEEDEREDGVVVEVGVGKAEVDMCKGYYTEIAMDAELVNQLPFAPLALSMSDHLQLRGAQFLRTREE